MDAFLRVSKIVRTDQFASLIALLDETTDGYIECHAEISNGVWLILLVSRYRDDAERLRAFRP